MSSRKYLIFFLFFILPLQSYSQDDDSFYDDGGEEDIYYDEGNSEIRKLEELSDAEAADKLEELVRGSIKENEEVLDKIRALPSHKQAELLKKFKETGELELTSDESGELIVGEETEVPDLFEGIDRHNMSVSDQATVIVRMRQRLPKEQLSAELRELVDNSPLKGLFEKCPKCLKFGVMAQQDPEALPSLAGIVRRDRKVRIVLVGILYILTYFLGLFIKSMNKEKTFFSNTKNFIIRFTFLNSLRIVIFIAFFFPNIKPVFDLAVKVFNS